MELSWNLLSWSSGSSVLAFSVPLCSSACHVGVRCACCATPGTSLWSALDGLAIPELYSQASSSGNPFGRAGRSYYDRTIGYHGIFKQEDCAQWSSDRVEPDVLLYAAS